MNTIRIEVIPHKQQRYETCGDWYFRREADLASGRQYEVLVIRVSDLGDWRHNMLVAIHELVEVALCKRHGVTQAQVDAFDIQYEKDRPAGDESEPGDHPAAPYKREHCAATGIERMLAALLEVGWAEYEKAITSL